MADTEEKNANTEEETVEGAEGEGKVKGKRKLIIIIAAVLLLVGIGAGLAFSGVLGGGKDAKKEESHDKKTSESTVPAKPVYYELPEFLVNLSTGSGKTSFLKMTVTLELKNEASRQVMDANKPRVLDTFNVYLRELRPSDLAGSAGSYRLKEELMRRINATVEEGIVKDILFSEFIIQ